MAASKSPEITQVLVDLEALLAKKYPSLLASMPPPEPLEALEKELGARVPSPLRELWAWRNGAEAFLFASGDGEGMDWLGVSDAQSDLAMLRETVPEFPKTLLPFASDGAGNFTCIDVISGELFDWDHETRAAKRLKKGLVQALAAVVSAARSGKFQGGPEVVAKPSAQRTKALRLIAEDPVDNMSKVSTLAGRMDAKDGVEVLRQLRDALKGEPGKAANAQEWLAVQEARAGDFEAALASVNRPEILRSRSIFSSLWDIAELALVAEQPAAALTAYGLWKEPPTHALVGKALALARLGRPTADAIEAARRANDAEYGETSKQNDPTWAAVFRAMLLAIEGHVDQAKESLATASKKSASKYDKKILDNPTDRTLPFSRLGELVGL